MNPTLPTIAETIAATVPGPTYAPPPPVSNVMVMNDFQWLTSELNKIQEIDSIIMGFLLFFTVCLLGYFTYKFFRIFF